MKKSFDTKRFISQNSIWLVLILMVAAVSIARPVFLGANNIETLLTGESVKGVLACGIMWCILSGGNDLSAGSVVALVSVVTASLAQNPDAVNRLLGEGEPMAAAFVILAGILIGLVVGVSQGAIIAYTKIPPFIATLGGQLICRAASKMYSTQPVSNLTDSFRFFGRNKIGGVIPVIIIVFLIFFVINAFMLTQTRFGKNVFAVGGNVQAARVAGINVEKTLIKVYAWSGCMAAVGGILLAGRTGSADPSTYGLNYELDAIAAATIGGTSHSGGIARISGVLCGILIMGVINNGLVLLAVNDNLTNVIKGVIMIAAVAFDMRKNAKRA